MQKNHEGSLRHHLPERAVFVFSCLLSIPTNYIEDAKMKA